MSRIERNRPQQEVAPRHIPQVVVPVPPGDARQFLRDALSRTGLFNPFIQVYAGWAAFEPHVRFTPVDAGHTLIELDVAGKLPGAEALLAVQRRGEIDRFFVAIQDELDDRERPRPRLIAELRRSGEFLECNELASTPEGARIVRRVDGAVSIGPGPLHDDGDFASGYYLLDCAGIDRACEIAAQLHESRFAPIEVRQVGE